MGRLQRIEQRLERAINGAFAKAFRAEVQPVEIASAVRRAMDERAQSMTKGRTFVPADYTIELSPNDYERLCAYEEDVCDELLAAAEEHADSQRYLTRGPFTMAFTKGSDLETGVFRIHPGDGSPARHEHDRPAARHEHDRPAAATPAPAADPDPPPPAESVPVAPRANRPVFDLERDGTYEPEVAAGRSDATFDRDAPPARRFAGASAAPPAPAPGAAADRAATARPEAERAAAAYDQEALAAHDPAPHTLSSATRREARGPARPMRASDRPWLEIDGDRYPLLGPLTVLGRDTIASIVVEDANVSRRHCEVRVTSDGPHLVTNIRDLGSTNGTWVNGQRVTSVRLHDHDQVTIGRTSMTFHAGR